MKFEMYLDCINILESLVYWTENGGFGKFGKCFGKLGKSVILRKTFRVIKGQMFEGNRLDLTNTKSHVLLP